MTAPVCVNNDKIWPGRKFSDIVADRRNRQSINTSGKFLEEQMVHVLTILFKQEIMYYQDDLNSQGLLVQNKTRDIRVRKKSCFSWAGIGTNLANMQRVEENKKEILRRPKTSNTDTLTIEEVKKMFKV